MKKLFLLFSLIPGIILGATKYVDVVVTNEVEVIIDIIPDPDYYYDKVETNGTEVVTNRAPDVSHLINVTTTKVEIVTNSIPVPSNIREAVKYSYRRSSREFDSDNMFVIESWTNAYLLVFFTNKVSKIPDFANKDKIRPAEDKPLIYSKMKCVAELMKIGKWEQVKAYLQSIGIYDLYLAANNFSADNEYFKSSMPVIKEQLGLTDDQIQVILNKCISDDYYK